MKNSLIIHLDNPPRFEGDLWAGCRTSGDYRPILFEWYKHVSKACILVAMIDVSSPAFRCVPQNHYAVLVGLLNRCSRLMLANIRLSCTGKYGETTRIVDRCIAESALKLSWLCQKRDVDCFVRFLAEGLKRDLELRSRIRQFVANRAGNPLPIENRMLSSIDNVITLSGLFERQIEDAKKIPDFASMLRDLNSDALTYTTLQRMGSHAVHGTWSDLVFCYLTYDEERGFRPQDLGLATEDCQFLVSMKLVLSAMMALLRFMAKSPENVEWAVPRFAAIDAELMTVAYAAWGQDLTAKE